MEAVVATVALLLLAAAFIGNLYASRRRAVARPSIYESIRRRLEAERSAGPPEEP